MYMQQKDKNRFFDKIVINKEDECWLWLGKTDRNGYGAFSIRSSVQQAHRIAYILGNNDDLKKGERIEHTCKQRLCCNSKHIVLTTISIKIRQQQSLAFAGSIL